jgi:glycosyltransferase involved in cell wall biosynthesis
MHVGIVGLFPADESAVFSGPMRVVHQLSIALSVLENADVTLIRANRFRNLFQPPAVSRQRELKVATVSYPLLIPYLKARSDLDILNVHGVSFFNWMALSNTVTGHSYRTVFTAHGFIPLENQYGFHHSKLKNGLEKSMLRKSDHVTTVSKETKALLTKAYSIPPRNIKVIGNGVDTAFFNHLQDQANIRPRKKNVELVFVGSILSIKGIDFLLKALDLIKELPFTLHLVGAKTPYCDCLTSSFPRLFRDGRVIFEGTKRQDALRQAYAAADIFVLTSVYDQYPQVVLEACAMGLPVIISDRVGVKAVLRNGEEGYIVPYGNSPFLAEKIKCLILDPEMRKRMGKKARAKAEKYSWSAIAASYLDYFSGILS